MIGSATDFIKYFESVRRRTLNYIRVVPEDQLGWAPKQGEFTCGDILRHILSAERMFVRVATEGRWKYEDHEEKQKQIKFIRIYSGMERNSRKMVCAGAYAPAHTIFRYSSVR